MTIFFTADDRTGFSKIDSSLGEADNGKAILIYAEVHDQKLTPAFVTTDTVDQVKNAVVELAEQLNTEAIT